MHAKGLTLTLPLTRTRTLTLNQVMHAKGSKRKMTADDGKPRQFKFKQVRSR